MGKDAVKGQNNIAQNQVDASLLQDLLGHIKQHLDAQNNKDSDELLSEDIKVAGDSFRIENLVDISGILIAYPFYLTTLDYIYTHDKAPHEVTNELYGQVGSLSSFVGFLCGISFTSAAGMPIKELLADQQRENKINMLSTMYQQMLRAVVISELHKSLNEDETEQARKNAVSRKIQNEITDTQNALGQILIQIGAKHARVAASNDPDEIASIEKEVYLDIRTQVVYEKRLAYLAQLNTTVTEDKTEITFSGIVTRDKTLDEVKIELLSQAKKDKHKVSRDIVNELHRPANADIPFNQEVFARVKPVAGQINVSGNTGGLQAQLINLDFFNDYGVPAARIHYEKLIELIAELANCSDSSLDEKKQRANQYLMGMQLEGFFTHEKTQAYVNYLLTPKTTKSAKSRTPEVIKFEIYNKKAQIKPYDDIFNNYTVRKSTSHYANLILLIGKLLAHEKPGKNDENWVAIGSQYLKGTALENYFKNPKAKHLQEFFFNIRKQRAIYLEQQKRDPVNVNPNGVIFPRETPTYKDQQQIHAEDLAIDIKRKLNEITFHENQYDIINPVPGIQKELSIRPRVGDHADDATTTVSTVSSDKAAEKDTQFITLAPQYDTQLATSFDKIVGEISHLASKISYFIKSVFEASRPNNDWREEYEKVIDYENNGIKTTNTELFIANAHVNLVYPTQSFLYSEKQSLLNNTITRLMIWPFYMAGLIVYKAGWAMANFPTLLETLQHNVDALSMGARNFEESLIASKDDSILDILLLKPIVKITSLALLTPFKLVFGFMYWVLGPFANNNTTRKTARKLLMRVGADVVDDICDILDPIYYELSNKKAALDEQTFTEALLFEYAKLYGQFALLGFAYTIVHACILPWALVTGVGDFIKAVIFSIPLVPLVYTAIFENNADVDNHDVASKKVSDVSSTVRTRFSILWQKMFARPWDNTWSWFDTAWGEVSKRHAINYYGSSRVFKGAAQLAQYLGLIAKLGAVLLINVVFGIINSLMWFFKQAPVLTFISFTTSTLAAGLTLPGILVLEFSAEVSGYIMMPPMVFEPMNSTRDLYNNAVTQEHLASMHKLKTPVKNYRRFIRHYLIGKLTASGIEKNKDSLAYQAALTQLEARALTLMPRMPMNEADVKAFLGSLFKNGILDANNLSAVDASKTIAIQRIEKHEQRTAWAKDCLEYAAFSKRGKELAAESGVRLSNNPAAYKGYLAGKLAELFKPDQTMYGQLKNYYVKHKKLDTLIDYFYQQYNIDKDFAGSEQYQQDCQHAFMGFAEVAAHRFLNVASEERYRRSLDAKQETPSIFYINGSGAALPCTVKNSGDQLTLNYIDNGQPKIAVFKAKTAALSSSAYLHERYDAQVNEDTSINMNSFIYTEHNTQIDLEGSLTAFEKDFSGNTPVAKTQEQAADNSATSISSASSAANPTMTRAPLITLCKYGQSASSDHLNKEYAHQIDQTLKSRGIRV